MESKSLFKIKPEVSSKIYRPVKYTASPSPDSFSWILPSYKKLSKDTFFSPNSLYFLPVTLLSKHELNCLTLLFLALSYRYISVYIPTDLSDFRFF